MSWEAVTAISAAFTGIVIAVTAIVAVYQLIHLRAQRRDTAAIEIIRSLQDPELARAFTMIMTLERGISAPALRAKGAQYEEAAHLLGLRFEMLGVLVYRGAIAYDVAADLAAGGVAAVWERLKETILETREVQGQPTYLEWFQWLAEHYEREGYPRKAPAHERHRGWRP